MTEPLKPYAFYDLPEEAFPFTITQWDEDGNMCFQATVEGPGVVEIPGLESRNGKRVTKTVIRYADALYADGTT